MPVIAQYAEEKQTILSFVAAGLGIALVPASYKRHECGRREIPCAHAQKTYRRPSPQRDVASGK